MRWIILEIKKKQTTINTNFDPEPIEIKYRKVTLNKLFFNAYNKHEVDFFISNKTKKQKVNNKLKR